MSRNLLTVARETSLVDASAAQSDKGRRRSAFSWSSNSFLVGILTERDVLRAAGTVDIGGTVGDWMTHHPEMVDADQSTQQARVADRRRRLPPPAKKGRRTRGDRLDPRSDAVSPSTT